MGAAFVPYLKHLPKRKSLPILFFMCDESWAMALADARNRQSSEGDQNCFSMPYYLCLAIGMHITWVGFTTIGAIIGPIIGNIDVYGFDMAFIAVFLVLLRGMWNGFRAAFPWSVSLAVAVTTYLLIPGALYVATGTLSGVVVTYIWGKR